MQPFAQPQRMNQLGKIDRWLVNFFSLASLAFIMCYVCTNVWNKDIYTEAIVGFLALIVVLKALSVPTVHAAFRERGLIFLAFMLVVAVINTIVSWNNVESALRWTMWFGLVVCFARVSSASDGRWMDALIRRLPWLFSLIYISIVAMGRYLTPDAAALSFHLSGLYGNLIFASGLFAVKFWQRLMWSVVGFITIYFSGASGALFTIPIMLIPYILYSTTSMPVKGFVLASIFFMGALLFFESQLFSSFLNIKVNALGAEYADTGLERMERSRDVRLQLVEYGLLLTRENPMGTGLGHTYFDDMFEGAGVVHAHNGTISMLIELGVPGFTVTLAMILWVFVCIFRNPSLSVYFRSFYFTFFFTIFGRSLSENYTPLDLGNYFNWILLLFSTYMFLNQKIQHQPVAGPARPYGRMIMRPGLRPSMPRSVGVR